MSESTQKTINYSNITIAISSVRSEQFISCIKRGNWTIFGLGCQSTWATKRDKSMRNWAVNYFKCQQICQFKWGNRENFDQKSHYGSWKVTSRVPKAEKRSNVANEIDSLLISLPAENASFIGANLNDHKIEPIRIDPSISLRLFYTCNKFVISVYLWPLIIGPVCDYDWVWV